MNKRWFWSAVIVLSAAFATGVVRADESASTIRLNADYAAFRMEGDSTRAYVEIFYNLPRNQLSYEPDSSGYLAIIDLSIWLKDTTGAVIDSMLWKAGNRIKSLAVLDGSDFLISDLIREVFPVGLYTIEMEARNNDNSGFCSFKMEIPPVGGSLKLSSLELAYEITPDTANLFSKAGYKVLPNPSRQFSQDNNVIYLYAEGYNLDTAPDSDTLYSVKIDILDKDGNVYKEINPSQYRKPGNSAVIMTGFSTATLPSDNYIVQLTLVDGENTAVARKEFSITTSRQRIRQEMLESVLKDFPEANKITNEEEAQKFRDDITFIATPAELKLYDSLNLAGKANFQHDFWHWRDPTPDTPENEYKLEHYRRIKYADDNFGQYRGFIRGWQTDMGRIYILYGEPSEMERNPSSIEERSWQRWWYDSIEGGVYFVFVDFEDTGNFTLVHSSKKNEIKDYNWEDKVKMTLFQR